MADTDPEFTACTTEEYRDLRAAWEAVLDLLPLALTGAGADRDDLLKVGEIHGSDWYRRLDAAARKARYSADGSGWAKVTVRDLPPVKGASRLEAGEAIGYVCGDCWWWVPTLATVHPHCQHERVAMCEHLMPDQVANAKMNTRNGEAAPRAYRPMSWHPTIDEVYRQGDLSHDLHDLNAGRLPARNR